MKERSIKTARHWNYLGVGERRQRLNDDDNTSNDVNEGKVGWW